MLMGFAKTGLGVCSDDRNDDSPARPAGQVLQLKGEILLQICCRYSYGGSPVQFLIAASCPR
jgi:hypothetical protein